MSISPWPLEGFFMKLESDFSPHRGDVHMSEQYKFDVSHCRRFHALSISSKTAWRIFTKHGQDVHYDQGNENNQGGGKDRDKFCVKNTLLAIFVTATISIWVFYYKYLLPKQHSTNNVNCVLFICLLYRCICSCTCLGTVLNLHKFG